MSLFRLLPRNYRSTPSSWKPTPLATSSIGTGRRYLCKQPYALPKDRQEEERLAFQHQLLYTHLHRHFFAPLFLPSIRRILDVGCGPGYWLRDTAALVPLAELTGVDSDEHQLLRTGAMAHRFCRLLHSDVLEGLPFQTGTFDYTHMRCMVLAIPARCWPFVIGELVRVTAPGGFVELFDGGQDCERAGPNMQQILTWGQRFVEPQGFDLRVVEHLGEMMRTAGVQDICEQRLTIPIGTWGGRVGKLMEKDLQAIIQAMRTPLCTALSLTPARFDAVVQALPHEWDSYHTSYTYIEAHGQKGANGVIYK